MPEVHGRRPRRSLGQNFLKDPRVAARIVRACKLSPGDRVLEVGPGRGALTRLLAERGSHLVLVEKDRALAAALEERYASSPEVRVLEGDAVTL
ncbi:MAG: 16S rRNA (adenine(1518)-N(6)/adenine(1519)-N(6))-dimethyltransferase, partial [Deltaproteobacteria bacterium]|nr:16S rRNA (adenine(1518)-N(6)/adenine(1519)-N(6))-dimethyltransferase [Deltaproteobacteria bacterium]